MSRGEEGTKKDPSSYQGLIECRCLTGLIATTFFLR